jgi:hypothetical protein
MWIQLKKWRKKINQWILFFEYFRNEKLKEFQQSWIYHFIFSRAFGLSWAKRNHHSLHLEYIFEGGVYEIYLPLENRIKSKMLNSSLEIETLEHQKIKIEQQPGIPILITPRQIGAERITVYQIDQGEMKTFYGNEKVVF